MVKTYPITSKSYSELVCTAGLRNNGSWIRIYPVPFRLLSGDKQYKRYDIIEVIVRKNESDPRPESFRIENSEEIKIIGHLDESNNWQRRKDIILQSTIYKNMEQIIQKNREGILSLATFKPTQIIKFYAKKTKVDNGRRKIYQDLKMQITIFLVKMN